MRPKLWKQVAVLWTEYTPTELAGGQIEGLGEWDPQPIANPGTYAELIKLLGAPPCTSPITPRDVC